MCAWLITIAADSSNLYTELQNVGEAATPLRMRFGLTQLTYVDGVCSYLVSTLHVTISSPESDRSRRSENVAGPSILTPSQLEIITRPNLVVELVKVVYEKGIQHLFNPFRNIFKKLGSRMVDHHYGRQHKSVHGASKRRRSGNATSYAFSITSTNVRGWGLMI